MKSYGGVDVHIHVFLTSALGVREWSASRPGRFNPGESAASTHWIGVWAGPRTYRDSNCDPSVVPQIYEVTGCDAAA
jgi:hypothetical protein